VVQPELVLIAVAAVLPPAALALLAARIPAPPERSRLGALLAFSWGAIVASWAATMLNARAAAWMTALLGAGPARALVPSLVAPGIEELMKAIGFGALLLAAPRALATPRSALAAGALLGLGFAAAENVEYYTLAAVQAGWAGVGRAVYLRGFVQAGNHAVFTATVGVALGWAARRAASIRATAGATALGLVAAVSLHALWNGVMSDRITAVVCNPPVPGGACAPAPDAVDLLVRVPLLEAAFLLPIVAVLVRIVRRVDGPR
jgi:RsiW-degrading membrane proteinase PrsW (M82 family)